MPSPAAGYLHRCCFVDTINGWACGENGTVIRTTNSGSAWELLNTGLQGSVIEDICFINSNTGWIVANDGGSSGTKIGKTTNGGTNWTISPFSDSASFNNTIYFTDQLTGFLSGYSGKIFKTTDGGTVWVSCFIQPEGCPSLYGFPKHRIRFLNALTGFACGGQFDIQGMIWKTTDAGNNWQTFCLGPEPMFDILPVNASKVIASGGDGEFGATTATSYNNSQWIYDTTGLFGVGRDLAFRTPSELWMPLSFAQTWALNLDSGSVNSVWYQVPGPDSTSIYAAVFKSPTFGFGFGSNGGIVKYNVNVIGVQPQNNIPVINSLRQNYPNPFNPSTLIEFELRQNSFIKIIIYDLVGREVEVLFSGMKPAGVSRILYQNTSLASGVYFYRLTAGVYSESKKMVILK
jgi:photosystem II stability/assembly factor-like uncharacterized protein